MKGNTRTAAPLGLLLMALAPFAQAQQEGNASAATCLSRSEVTAGTSPAALMNALPRCVQDGRMQDAIDLYNIAGETGHSAYNALKAMAGSAMGEENLGRFDSALKAQLSPDKAPAYVAGICSFSKRVGPPSYTPTYMLAHGMSNFTGTGGGLVSGFEPASAWQATLSQYLKCPG